MTFKPNSNKNLFSCVHQMAIVRSKDNFESVVGSENGSVFGIQRLEEGRVEFIRFIQRQSLQISLCGTAIDSMDQRLNLVERDRLNNVQSK